METACRAQAAVVGQKKNHMLGRCIGADDLLYSERFGSRSAPLVQLDRPSISLPGFVSAVDVVTGVNLRGKQSGRSVSAQSGPACPNSAKRLVLRGNGKFSSRKDTPSE